MNVINSKMESKSQKQPADHENNGRVVITNNETANFKSENISITFRL